MTPRSANGWTDRPPRLMFEGCHRAALYVALGCGPVAACMDGRPNLFSRCPSNPGRASILARHGSGALADI